MAGYGRMHGRKGGAVENCLVLGSGRSGTSMVAGILDRAGYHTGDNYLDVRRANPHGFFEDSTVNSLNDRMLAPYRITTRRWVLRRGLVPWWKRFRTPGWLLETPPEGSLASIGKSEQAISELVSREPFAYKDPRFAHTLSAWRPYLPDRTRFVCVFRHPAVTADSIRREVSEASFLQRFDVDPVDVWTATYRAILDQREGEWLFVHFEQIIGRGGVRRLGDFLGAELDGSFVDLAASRARRRDDLSTAAVAVYRELCRLANY